MDIIQDASHPLVGDIFSNGKNRYQVVVVRTHSVTLRSAGGTIFDEPLDKLAKWNYTLERLRVKHA